MASRGVLLFCARAAGVAVPFLGGALACGQNVEVIFLGPDGAAPDANLVDATTHDRKSPPRDGGDAGHRDATLDTGQAGDESTPMDSGDGSFPLDAPTEGSTGEASMDAAADTKPSVCPTLGAGGFASVRTGAGGPWAIAVSPTDLFWTEVGGEIYRMSLSDCSTTVLASKQNYPMGITLAGAAVYWSNSSAGENSGSIAVTPQTGGSIATLATNLNSPGDLTNDGTYLYFMPNSNDYLAVVSQMPLAGGAVVSLGTGALGEDILTTGGWVYWTDYFAGAVLALPPSGGPVVTMVSGLPIPWGIATDSANLYWTEYAGGDAGSVLSVPATAPEGGTPSTLVAGLDSPYGVATDGVNVYFGTSGGSLKAILKVPVGGGAVTTIATGPTSANRMVVDTHNVYWTDFFGGFVNMAPK